MSYAEVMKLPVRAFWLLSDMIERVRADEKIHALDVGVASEGGEACENLSKRLQQTVGTVLVLDSRIQLREKLDEDGLNSIRGLGNTTK